MRYCIQAIPIETSLSIISLRRIDRAEVARVGEMQELFAAGIARHDWPHRVHHVIVTIDFVDERDARLGILMSTRDDPVPDVGRIDHSWRRWLFDQSVGKIRGVE